MGSTRRVKTCGGDREDVRVLRVRQVAEEAEEVEQVVVPEDVEEPSAVLLDIRCASQNSQTP